MKSHGAFYMLNFRKLPLIEARFAAIVLKNSLWPGNQISGG